MRLVLNGSIIENKSNRYNAYYRLKNKNVPLMLPKASNHELAIGAEEKNRDE